MRLMKAVFDFVIILERMRQDYLFMRMEIFACKIQIFQNLPHIHVPTAQVAVAVIK